MAGIKIKILLVDDDCTALNIVAEHLQKMNHHVIAMKNPLEALATLRENYEAFDLLLTDVHMPEMSGIDLLKHVKEESQLPVVLMSADCDKDIMLKGLRDGAAFYLVKPLTPESLTKLWQFAIYEMKNSLTSDSPIVIRNPTHFRSLLTTRDTNKKQKLIWTTSLHNLFLEAIKTIGIERAVPKKILEYMNIPGLKRQNIASHLQKYRIFMKRMMEKSNTSENGIPGDLNQRPLRSSFVMNEITYLANNFQQQYHDLLAQRRRGFIDGQGGVVPMVDSIGGGSFHIGNPQLNSCSNYVGLQMNNNGELIGTTNDISAYNNLSYNAPPPPFGMDDHVIYGRLDDANQGMNREPFGPDMGFGLFDGNDNGSEGYEGMDQVNILINHLKFKSIAIDQMGETLALRSLGDARILLLI
ncbi:two-component response regulator ARR14-like [Silene latifolia]|uniref:two-component response regulator ARR14-like n=1 Tax=Silene latifolia TaxID=37657 RepID=UPI003D77F5FE